MTRILRLFSMTFIMLLAATGMSAQTVEKQLYYSDITDWTAGSTTQEAKTRFNNEAFTFTTTGDIVVAPATTINTRKGYAGLTATNKSGTIETSAISSITKVEFEETVGRGGGNGFKLEVKGDGDSDWVTLVNSTITSTATQTVNVNRTNVKLRWSNLTTTKAVYLTSVKIQGNVAAEKVPSLQSMKVNGAAIDAATIFAEQNDGTMAATIEISKSQTMIGDANPITDIVAKVGTVKATSYNGDATKCTANITVTNGSDDVVYVVNAVQKPDFTVTIQQKDGPQVTTLNIEKDSPIGDFSSILAGIQTTDKVRGLYAKEIYTTGEKQVFDYYRKIDASEIITNNITFYAIVTPAETSADPRHEYIFNDHINSAANPYFYAEDHEGIEVAEGSMTFAGGAHGAKVAAGSKIKVYVSNESLVNLRLCSSNAADNVIKATTSAGGSFTINAKGKADNNDSAFRVNDSEWLTMEFAADTYLHAITVTNNLSKHVSSAIEGINEVVAGDAAGFLAAIEMANGMEGYNTIVLPNGTYDIGETVLTTITKDNVSIIGESMEGTVIKNAPLVTKEGINLTATIRNRASNLYMQDLTLQNAMNYYGSSSGAGRGVALMDEGSNTICKNVCLHSYQDTYYSHKAANFYWEDSRIHGTVDYLCGDGNIIYNRTTLVNENRQKSDTPSGSTTVAAPYTSASCQWGYVFLDCTIDCKSATFNLGRSWGGNSRLNYIRTTLLQPTIIDKQRFTPSGMNVAAYGFYEYKSMDVDGTVVSPASNVINFTHSTGNRQYETILTDAEAEKYTVANIFGSWAPDQICAQVTDVEKGTVFLVDGKVTTVAPASGKVRIANARGGFGPEVTVTPTGISNIKATAEAAAQFGKFVKDGRLVVVKNGMQYNAAGQRMQ